MEILPTLTKFNPSVHLDKKASVLYLSRQSCMGHIRHHLTDSLGVEQVIGIHPKQLLVSDLMIDNPPEAFKLLTKHRKLDTYQKHEVSEAIIDYVADELFSNCEGWKDLYVLIDDTVTEDAYFYMNLSKELRRYDATLISISKEGAFSSYRSNEHLK